jgi:hypothetical protein
MTLIRLIRALPEPVTARAPAVLGVDDFALRRGQVYATVLINAETGQRAGVLDGRKPRCCDVAEWPSRRRGRVPGQVWYIRDEVIRWAVPGGSRPVTAGTCGFGLTEAAQKGDHRACPSGACSARPSPYPFTTAGLRV